MIRYILPVLLSLTVFPVLAENALHTAPVTRSIIPVVYQSHGFVEAVHKATIKAETSGRIAELYFDVDDIVDRGEVIARFSNTRQKAELELAQAGLEEARAEYERSQSDFRRIQDLYEKKLVAVAALDKARADQDAAQARLKGAEARVKKARQEYEYTVVRAPYSGIVTRRHVEVGEAVSPGSPLISGLSLDSLRAVVDIPQSHVDRVRTNKQAFIYLASGEQLSSDQLTVFPYADENSHTFRVRVELQGGVEGLYPGMMIRIGFVVGETDVLLVPDSAIVNRGEITAVYVQYEDRRIVMRQVRVGERVEDNRSIVHAGLSEGEQVFTDPQAATVALKQQIRQAP